MRKTTTAPDIFLSSKKIPDDILSGLTVKDFLHKWVSYLVSHARQALYSYYAGKDNPDFGDKTFVMQRFGKVMREIEKAEPFLLDLVNEEIQNFEDLCIKMYGYDSPEALIVLRFNQLYFCATLWKQDAMWNDCGNDERMRKVLFGE